MDLPFRAEYAKSGRSCCRSCQTRIAKDTLRLAVMSQADTFDRKIPGWYHDSCFFETQLVKSVGDISNFESLRWKHQQLIRNKVAGAPSGSTSGVSNGISAGGIEDTILVEQNEMMFRYRDHLKSLQRKHLTALLEYNNQEPIAPVTESIHDRLADAMTFGALFPCEECGHRQIVFRSPVGYFCTGFKNEWVKCEAVTDDPKRKPFLVPHHLKKTYEFLASYKYKPQKRILQYNKPTDSNPLSFSGGKYESNLPSRVKLKIQNGMAVDPITELEDVAHVYRFHKDIYAAVLSLVDLQSGRNSYYKLQVLESNDRKMYYLFRAWGRVGTDIGEHLLEIKAGREDAIADFEALFEEKTANKWRTRANFKKVADKMNWVDVSYEYESAVPSTLQQPVHNLISLIFNEDTMKHIMLEFELDTEKMPLGKLSKEQIMKAFKVLNELQKYISTSGDRKTILALTNQFYTLIPHSFGVDNPPLLDDPDTLKQKDEMLRALMEMEIAYSILKDVESENNDAHPIDTYYLKLKTDISPLNKTDPEFQTIQLYVQNSHAKMHRKYVLEIVEIFKVEREGEHKRYEPFKKVHNRKLLWHGSRLPNFAGILSQGLRVAPPDAPMNGYMFGKGIYFADRVSKSANYCDSKNTNNTGLVLLCQVALGNMYKLRTRKYLSKPPAGKHSVIGLGKIEPDPSQSIFREDGVEIPLGKGIRSRTHTRRELHHNEYVVYDVAQVKVEYLVQLKFIYK
ncbi:poly [ADP-ribose] polymerase-like [Planococcus citri]|uniref:poly [ADP-ribose] polymerase-like n=1 Tax=Planococcus citri TaxID=170843 RepID=UPI0031F9D176